ncbi:MAG: hypothetical protein ACO1OB_21070 [Archangium sp.]
MARSRVAQLGAVLLLAGCASSRQLSIGEAQQFGERRYEAATDEIYDATWLALEARGASVIDGDRLAGTMVVTQAVGATFDVDIAALGSEQRVVFTPREGVSSSDWSDLLDDVKRRVRATIRVWHDLPEWKFDGRRNSLSVPGYSLQPPEDWAWLDFDVSRRRVNVQEKRARGVENLTMTVELERRRVKPSMMATLQRAVTTMLAARVKVKFPSTIEAEEDGTGAHGTWRVFNGGEARDVAWHGVEVPLGDTQVTVVMVCPLEKRASCDALWPKVFDSQVNR